MLVSADIRFFWKQLSTCLGVADPANSETPFKEKIALRRARIKAYMAALNSLEEVEAGMAKMNLAWGEIRDPTDIVNQVTVKHRGVITQVDDRQGGTRPVTQSPYRFSKAKSGVRGPAPHRGEHNNEVLKQWLGKSDQEVEALRAQDILQAE